MSIKDILACLDDPTSLEKLEKLKIFCDIRPKEFELFGAAWQKVKQVERGYILELLDERQHQIRTNEIGLAIFQSEVNAELRAVAISILDVEESGSVAKLVIEAASNDHDKQVRLSAISALGTIVYNFEMDEIDSEIGNRVVNLLMSMKKDPNAEIQQAALIAVANTTSDEIQKWIKDAFNKSSPDWQEAALWAVGNNLSTEWESRVIDGLFSQTGGIRKAAIVSAGLMGLEKSRERLIELLDEEEGSDLFEEVIYSLAKIGGDQVQTIFEAIIANTDDVELIEVVKDAMDELEFSDPEAYMRTHGDLFGLDDDYFGADDEFDGEE